eukprot:jgi/Tetstr1/441073/TSEL_029341.t1
MDINRPEEQQKAAVDANLDAPRGGMTQPPKIRTAIAAKNIAGTRLPPVARPMPTAGQRPHMREEQAPQEVDALDGAEGGFALGDLWAALDEQEEDQLIEEVVEGLLNDVDASNQEGEECDHENAYAYSSSEAEDSGDDEDELYFSPLPTRNPRRDTLYGHAYLVDDAMSDDEMEPRRGKGSNARLWAGHEKATSEHTFETWNNSTDCAMEKEQQQAFARNRPLNEIHEVHVLRSRIQPKYLGSLETTLISRGIKYEDSRIVRRLEGAERLDY